VSALIEECVLISQTMINLCHLVDFLTFTIISVLGSSFNIIIWEQGLALHFWFKLMGKIGEILN